MPKDDLSRMDLKEKDTNIFSDGESKELIPQHSTTDNILVEMQETTNANFKEYPKEVQKSPEPAISSESVLETEKGINPVLDDISESDNEDEKTASPPQLLGEGLFEIQLCMKRVEQNVKTLADSSIKIASEVREMHKLYHNEFAYRLKSMQDDLERYREIEKGRIFDNILGEVAKLYGDHEALLEDITDENLKKRVRYLFEDINQVLEANGVSKQKSTKGDKRNTRHCQVRERILTNNIGLHDTVARSNGTGFYVENRTLIKEPVDIYFYSENADVKSDEK